jgi:hypothetical protein
MSSEESPMVYESEDLRAFLAQAIEDGKKNVVALAATTFGISRQAIHKHLSEMVSQGILEAKGQTRGRVYRLKELVSRIDRFEISNNLREDVVWREVFAERLSGLADNVRGICNYGLTEMLNNAIEHSSGKYVTTSLNLTYASITLLVLDDGIGVFRRIKEGLGLVDEREAILELSKGKLTTDPARHSGEGIFFTTRMFDTFILSANGLNFCHGTSEDEEDDWLIQDQRNESNLGTIVKMQLSVRSTRKVDEVFNRYTSGTDSPSFDKTHVPLRLLLVGEENLVSRSQAKRVLARFSRFKEVMLDFNGISQIGQAFADEIFRVFANQHPEIAIFPLRANAQVLNMIERAMSQDNTP